MGENHYQRIGMIKSVKSIIDEMMTLEGEKFQINRAQMSEIISKLSKLMAEQSQVQAPLTLHGHKLVKKQKWQAYINSARLWRIGLMLVLEPFRPHYNSQIETYIAQSLEN